ncbi:Spy0128 family protein, partial [Faecalibaculum rodentium]
DGNIGDVYRFTIDGEDGAPMPEETTVEIVNDGSTVYTGKFGPIAFADKDAGKSYTYTIKETANIAGMVTDPTVYKATYKIGKKTDGNGYDQLDPQLTITREDGSAADTAGVVFKNIYRKAEVAIPVTKTLQGRQMRPDETFVFELLEKGSSDVLQTLTIQGEEGKNSVTKSFEPIQFMDAAVKEY